ncbi:PREDICTED: homeobox protein HAT3.1 [Tarenaya hassleriana]|uniref:homeobox protein HAT3.1 n=1 Tax=Tarenaya hassleriana TaxID=28532 RepID=UPI00053C9A8E|nr:PREDICTED: homeobox protein HAT3.1 [Tarenaya hassleriana]XP_010556007.1 PREDICTED: homeobox protein HAT3.1 [Tarenaya hassleriana]
MSEQNVDCVPLKTSEPENNVENPDGLHHDVSNNGVSTVNGVYKTRKGKAISIHHASEVEPNAFAESGSKSFSTKNSGSRPEIVLGLPSCKQFETQHTRMFRNMRFEKKSHAQRSSMRCGSVVKSGSQEKGKEAVYSAVDEKRKRNMRSKKGKGKEDDEYTRIRRKLRYLLNRINYEQSLIDAYSSEGWKGLSLEKLRPEKELERATKEILRCKLRIRELFHHLGSLAAEGKLPESLFDSEGEIDSEDIFCAKCGSKDLSRANDIILCDGVCDRGFHQFCLEPPLRKEDIPPGDEGWLCPGCDCKVDCIDLLNELLGTEHSINDSWKKIFPETAAGGDQNLNLGLPSDDSDDDDYAPDGLDDDEKGDDDDDHHHSDDNKEAESEESSDDSEFTSASDEMVGASEGVQDRNLSTDDSEDENYDPDALNRDPEDENEESSSSDFTSDSEDLGALLTGDGSCQEDEVTASGEPSRENSQLHGNKEQSVQVSESDSGNEAVRDVPRRRSTERLDYKKLYDEAYGHVPSSSSDDEDWGNTARTTDHDSDSEDETTNWNEEDNGSLKQSSHANHTRKREQKSKSVKKSETQITAEEVANENGSLGEESKSSSDRKLRTLRLSKAFQENRYPDVATKENLARELGMTVTQVNNWFRNRRSSTSTALIKMVSKEDVVKLSTSKEAPGETSFTRFSQHASGTKSGDGKKAPRSRKRRRKA